MRRGRLLAGGGVLAAGTLAAAVAAAGGERPPARAAAGVPTGSATVARRDLVETDDVQGTLGFADARRLGSAAAGTVTRLRPEGSTVRRGQSVLSVDRTAQAHVLHGTVPVHRDLSLGVADGPDVRQLERNLRALGHDPGTVDGRFTSATAAAVRSWEEARGATQDGAVSLGEIIVSDGPLRVGEHRAEVGDRVAQGAPVTDVTSMRRVVTARLDAGRQGAVRREQRVEVALPDGGTVAGRVTRVGRVARPAGDEGGTPTVELRVALRGGRARFDGAPVTISLATTTAKEVLTVPVTALVATGAGRYAVQDAGTDRLRPVEVGRIAGGLAEVAGVTEGARVAVPR